MESNGTWDDLRVLLAVHRSRSFLAAGKALGTSTSTVARRIAALEAALGRPLVHRSSSGAFVEVDALDLVALAEQLELGLRAIRRDDSSAALAGIVRVSMAEAFARPITQVLCTVQRAHPGLQLELVTEERVVDLGRREADVGIRSGRTASPSVIERSVGTVRLGLYAAPSYVERRIRSTTLRADDFARLEFIGNDEHAGHPLVGWLPSQGARRFLFRSNSEGAQLEAALQGQGIALLSEPQVRGLPLVRLEWERTAPSVPVFVAYHRELRNVPRVRLVVDALTNAIRDALR